MIASSAGVDEVVIWDVRRGGHVGRVVGDRQEGFSTLAFSPDGSKLAVAGKEKVVLWDTSLKSWLELAREIVKRELTPEERSAYFEFEDDPGP
jgi:hypothetical protein